MKKIRFYISFLLKIAIIIALLCGENTFANNVLNEDFAIIGENNDLNFHTNEQAHININTGKISGNFYIQGVGIAHIAPHSRKFGENEESFKIYFRAYNASIGYIMGNIEINKKTFLITGNITSLIGSLSLENISLNNPNTHLANLGNLQANHKNTIIVNNPKENEIYELGIYFHNQKIQTATENNNIFENLDLSLAGNYDFEFITKNENNTIIKTEKFSKIIVKPNKISNTIENGNFFAKKFCQENPTQTFICIDGKERKKSEIFIAKGEIGKDMKFEIQLRDKYGNRISSENVNIEFTKNEKIELQVPYYFVQASSAIYGTIGPKINNDYSFILIPLVPLLHNDELIIKSIKYGTNDITGIHLPAISIQKPADIQIQIPEKIFDNIGAEGKIISKNLSETIQNPKIIVKMIGNGNFENIITNSGFECEKNLFSHQATGLCKSDNFIEKVIAYNASHSEKNFKILPKISTKNTNLKMEFWLNYDIFGKNFSAKISEKNIIIEKPESKDVEIMDETHTIENISKNTTTLHMRRVSLLNLIRKNIAYLERNRINFDKNYIIYRNKDISEEIGNQPTKRTYIAIGHDITIKNDINNPINGPIVIISLSNGNNGGNIHIDGNITNINATLIAEKSILGNGTKTNQLYIKGSIMADNICNDNDNCFLKIRKDFDFTKSEHKKAKENNPNKIIIEYDPAIISDPPPALENFVE